MKFYINSFSVLSKSAEPLPKWKLWILKLINVKPLPMVSYVLLAEINDFGLVKIHQMIRCKDNTIWVVNARNMDTITIQSIVFLSEMPNICGEALIMCSLQPKL